MNVDKGHIVTCIYLPEHANNQLQQNVLPTIPSGTQTTTTG